MFCTVYTTEIHLSRYTAKIFLFLLSCIWSGGSQDRTGSSLPLLPIPCGGGSRPCRSRVPRYNRGIPPLSAGFGRRRCSGCCRLTAVSPSDSCCGRRYCGCPPVPRPQAGFLGWPGSYPRHRRTPCRGAALQAPDGSVGIISVFSQYITIIV